MRFFLRGFHLRKHLVSIIPRSFRPRRYVRLDSSEPETRASNSSSSKTWRWCKWFKRKAMRVRMCSSAPGYRRVRDEEGEVPKGCLAVYVGREESRVVVPVIYFNHPLFGELLKEAEDEFGYEHPGGIKLPCRISELEKVQSTIEKGCFGRKQMNWRRRKPKLLL